MHYVKGILLIAKNIICWNGISTLSLSHLLPLYLYKATPVVEVGRTYTSLSLELLALHITKVHGKVSSNEWETFHEIDNRFNANERWKWYLQLLQELLLPGILK